MLAPHHAGQALPDAADSPRDRWRVCAIVLLIFVIAASFSAMRKDLTIGFDEVAHAAYVAHVQKTGDLAPAFDDLRMIDPAGFRFTDKLNYLNHPSPYYVLMAWLGPRLEGQPGALLAHRLLNVVLASISLALLMAVGLVARLPRFSLYAYVIPLACIPVLAPIGGAINNDNLAFVGGSLATLAAWRLVATGSRGALLAALAGVVIAAWAKMTALILVGGMVGGVLLWALWRGRFHAWWTAPIAVAALLAVAPYAVFFIQYGSPAPATAGQVAMVVADAHVRGFDVAPRLSAPAFAMQFVWNFVSQWMPSALPRQTPHYAALAIPVATGLLAFTGVAVSILRLKRRQEGPLDVIVIAGAIAFAVTFAMHMAFGYRYHVTFGWMNTAYPRYYLPIAALLPLACLSVYAAIRHPRIGAALIVFLIVGPILFRAFGAPIG